jgi:hypothetical protein
MTKLRIALLSAIAVIGIALCLARYDEARLRTENESLRQQIQQAATIAKPAVEPEGQLDLPPASSMEIPSAQSPREDSNELLRLRGAVARMRQELVDAMIPSNLYRLDSNAQREAIAEALQTGVLIPVEKTRAAFPRVSWTFSGYATPKAAVQSLLWAMSEADAKTLLQSYTLDARQLKNRHEWNEKSDTEIAEAAKESLKGITGFRIDGQGYNPAEGNTVDFMLTVEDEKPEGPRIMSLRVKKIGSEWKCDGGGIIVPPIPAVFRTPPPGQADWKIENRD